MGIVKSKFGERLKLLFVCDMGEPDVRVDVDIPRHHVYVARPQKSFHRLQRVLRQSMSFA